MILAAIGFAALVIVLSYATVAYMMVAINNLGKYNIGGVPNTLLTKIGTLILGAVLYGSWVLLLEHKPFTITMKALT